VAQGGGRVKYVEVSYTVFALIIAAVCVDVAIEIYCYLDESTWFTIRVGGYTLLLFLYFLYNDEQNKEFYAEQARRLKEERDG
jgi:hypothetical protein